MYDRLISRREITDGRKGLSRDLIIGSIALSLNRKVGTLLIYGDRLEQLELTVIVSEIASTTVTVTL